MPADLPPFNNLRKALTDLEQCLTCAYCSRIYTNPFTLTTCGHTFCEHCVLIFVSGVKAQSLCPLCNIPIWLNQSQTNRQLKGLLLHYHQIRSLLGIQEPINVIPNYLKPKPYPKQRKGRKKSEKLFSNQSRDTLKSPQSVTDHSIVQTDDSTLREDSRSLASLRETNNADSVCDIIPSERSAIIDSKDGQEVTFNEANSNSCCLVECISPLTNANIKLCDDVMPTDSVIQEVIDNSDKLTSTPANVESVRRAIFQPFSKSEMLPRSINFFQLIDNEDSSVSSENIGKQNCIERDNTSTIVPHTNVQSPDIQRTDTPPIIPLTQRQTPINFHNSLIQDSNRNTQSPDIQRSDTPPIIPLTQRQTPINFHNSLTQDSNRNTQSPVITQIETSLITSLTQKRTPILDSLRQDSHTNTLSPGIQQLGTPTPGEIQETAERNSQSSDDSVIIESVQPALFNRNSAVINEATPHTVITNLNQIISPNTELEPDTPTKSPCTKPYDSPQENHPDTHSTYMCTSQPLPYEHILQVQKNMCHIPQIQLFNPILRFPPYNPTAQFLQIQTRTNSAVYYYPQQFPVRSDAKFVSNVNCPFRPNLPENYAPIPNSNSGVRSTNRFDFQDNSPSHPIIEPKIPADHFDVNATPERRDLEVEQKPLEQIHDSVESVLSSPTPDSPRNIDEQADLNESEKELSILCNGKSSINDESIEENNSPELRDNDEVTETIQSDIEPSRNSISDSFLRKYSLQLSPCSYSQNIQMNEVLSVAKDLSNKISRIDSDEDSNFSLGYQSPKFMRNVTLAKSPIINSLNRLARSPMARSSPENANAKISFTSPRVSTMDSFNSEMTIGSSLNIIDYADMSIDESLYKEKHFSPSLTSPIPSNHIKRRSNGFKSKKIKLSVGGIDNKRNKDWKTKRILSPTKMNEINQILKPQGKTRSMRKRYPQVS